MENCSVPDLGAAARHLECANTSLSEVVRALRNHDDAKVLTELGRKFSEMARLFRDGMLNAGLRVPLIDAKIGARAMGRSRSPKKLEALAKARQVRADNRRAADERRRIRKTVAGHTMGLHAMVEKSARH